MAQPIEIRGRNGRLIGSVSFDESPIHLQTYRTANGFNLLLPIEIASLWLAGTIRCRW
jgi:hypothetical protein